MPLLSGDAGTEQTVALIRAAVEDAWRDPLVRSTAGRIARSAGSGTAPGAIAEQARAIYEWVLAHIEFVRDPVAHETISSAKYTLTNGFGDCDDINAVLLPALLGAIGVRTRLVTVALDPRDPDVFTHVYCEAELDGRWIPLDAARPNASWGRGCDRYLRKRVWEISTEEFQDVAGLSGPSGPLAGLSGIDDWADVINTGLNDALKAYQTSQYPYPQYGGAIPYGGVNPYATAYGGSGGLNFYGMGNALPWIIGGLALVLVLGKR